MLVCHCIFCQKMKSRLIGPIAEHMHMISLAKKNKKTTTAKHAASIARTLRPNSYVPLLFRTIFYTDIYDGS